MKNSRKNQGITLVALVITIIIMLILVTVTITIALNGGLFEYAGKAASETQNKKQEEQNWVNVATGQDYDQLIAKYTKDPSIKIIHFSLDAGGNFDNLTAEEGMTFEQWIESDYNNTTICIDENGIIRSRPGLTDHCYLSNDTILEDGATYRGFYY